jgi:hypothetical protein
MGRASLTAAAINRVWSREHSRHSWQAKGVRMPSKSPQKNSAKKEPAKSLKEKRADKKAKGEDKARKG